MDFDDANLGASCARVSVRRRLLWQRAKVLAIRIDNPETPRFTR
jgi:hypothetical protein